MPEVLHVNPIVLVAAAIGLVLFGDTVVGLIRGLAPRVAAIRLHATPQAPATPPGDDYARGYRDGLAAANAAYAEKAPK